MNQKKTLLPFHGSYFDTEVLCVLIPMCRATACISGWTRKMAPLSQI